VSKRRRDTPHPRLPAREGGIIWGGTGLGGTSRDREKQEKRKAGKIESGIPGRALQG